MTMRFGSRGEFLPGVDCYVVTDDQGRTRRLIGATGFMRGIGAAEKGSLQRFLDRLPRKYSALASLPSYEIALPGGGVAKGYDAEHFIDVCNAYVEMLDDGTIDSRQVHMAIACRKVIRVCSKVGIAQIIDTATGHRIDEGAVELKQQLDRLLLEEAGDWELLWSSSVNAPICKLYGWPYDGKRIPRQMQSVMDMIYRLIFGDIPVNELQRINPDPASGHLHHQYIRPEHRPAVINRINIVAALARHSASPEEWRRKIKAEFGAKAQFAEAREARGGLFQRAFDFFAAGTAR